MAADWTFRVFRIRGESLHALSIVDRDGMTRIKNLFTSTLVSHGTPGSERPQYRLHLEKLRKLVHLRIIHKVQYTHLVLLLGLAVNCFNSPGTVRKVLLWLIHNNHAFFCL